MDNKNNKPNFTPGPWTTRTDGLGIDNKRVKIFDVSIGLEPKREDAHLIAASPDLFEALETISSGAGNLDVSEIIDIAEQALAKARGES